MEKFTLKKYLENPNVPTIDEDGRSVRILCTNLKRDRYPIIGAVKMFDEISSQIVEYLENYTTEGVPLAGYSGQLYFGKLKKKCWVCLFRDEDFPDIPRAEVTNSETQMLVYKALPGFIDCKKVEWEE